MLKACKEEKVQQSPQPGTCFISCHLGLTHHPCHPFRRSNYNLWTGNMCYIWILGYQWISYNRQAYGSNIHWECLSQNCAKRLAAGTFTLAMECELTYSAPKRGTNHANEQLRMCTWCRTGHRSCHISKVCSTYMYVHYACIFPKILTLEFYVYMCSCNMCKDERHKESVANLHINGDIIERLSALKVLGVTNVLSGYCIRRSVLDSWNAHVESTVTKAGKCLYVLYQLKLAGVSPSDLLRVYLSDILPVVEYACPVGHTNLPVHLSDSIETVQCTHAAPKTSKSMQGLFNRLKNKEQKPQIYSLHVARFLTLYVTPPVLPKIRTQWYFNPFMAWGVWNCTWCFFLVSIALFYV